MALNLGHNEGEANILAGRGPATRNFGTLADCRAKPAVIATSPILQSSPLAGLAYLTVPARPRSERKLPAMTDETKNAPKGPADGDQPAQKTIEVHVVGQFIKDLSFENPNIGKLLASPGTTPNVKLEINVAAKRVQPDLFESAIDFKAVASNTDGTIYDLELVYAGLFQIKNIPDQALEPFVLINCPTLIFPFLRRIVADITREGGFPPLLLDPIDFAQLFMRRKQELAVAGASGKPN